MSEIAYLRDERASGSSGGSCNAGVWATRVLNALGGNNSFVSLSNNRFKLIPGKYFIEIHAPAFQVAMSQAKLRVVETGEDVLIGSSAYSHITSPSMSHSVIQGELIVSQESSFEILQTCASTRNNTGFGAGGGFGTKEIYTQVKIIKTE